MIQRPRLNWLFFVVLLAGIAARMFVATLGHDYDMDNWVRLATMQDHHENIYVLTAYNFPPAWLHILRALYVLAGRDPVVFRYVIAGFLTLADAAIFFIVWCKFGRLAGCCFFLNPISIIVSGYQNNIDNLAILIGLIAAFLIKDEFEKPLNSQKLWGLVVLGLSLSIKHVFFAFPCWLAVKQKGMGQKLVVVLLPVSIFLLSFAPYWSVREEIFQHVFLYHSLQTAFFYHMYVPLFMQYMFSSQMLWALLLVLFAFIYREKTTVESMFLYTAVMVAFSPASINEYLSIPVCFVATHLNVFTLLYAAVGTLHLLVDYNGLRLTQISRVNCIDVAIYVLCLAVVWVTWRPQIIAWTKKIFAWFVFEIENQLGRGKKGL